jgi:3-carboxy-cis,cis-muconate cycloisomerase
MPVTPFDHPFFEGLLGDPELSALFNPEAELAAMALFEVTLAEAQAAEGLIPTEAAAAMKERLAHARLDRAQLAHATARDGLIVPELVAQWRRVLGDEHGRYLHHGVTSQDVIDTALAIRLGRACQLLRDRIESVIAALDRLAAAEGSRRVMAHTRMQAALLVSAARKIRSWRDPLARHLSRLDRTAAEVAVLHLGGPVGTAEAVGERTAAVAGRMAASLGLRVSERARHSERDGQAELAGVLSLIAGSLGKMGQDIALAAQSEVGEIRLASGGSSSAMPHKVNPIEAEVLVALARFNATLVSGMHQALVHENERSGAAWTLEWMLLPQMVVATGAALRLAAALPGKISFVPIE